ncbi:hypothetical protein KY289_013584 [Solanum tuberosum]|nr:hypothetical protein KY289_013584 [Solanum tuberosum]
MGTIGTYPKENSQPSAAQPATVGDQQATTSSSRRQPAAASFVNQQQQPPVPSTSSSSRQSCRPAARTIVATATHQPQSTNRAQAAAAPRTAAAGDGQATTINFQDWVIHKRILNFCPITSHKGEHLAECISNCLLDWNLDNVFTVTVDNASSNDVAVLELSKKLDMWGTNMMEDVPTRWNSTYLMLDTAKKFEKAFERFDLYDGNFNSFLATDVCEDGSIAGSIQYDDWANVRNITKFLEKFYELTLKALGSRYVTCNVHFEDICELDAYLKVCMTSDDIDLSKMASGMKEKFKKYWGTPEKMNKMLFIASVLDSRNKFMYVSFALEELLGEEKGQIVNNEVNAYLKNLFAIYVSKYAKGSKNQSSSSDSSDSSTYGLSQNVKTNSLRTKFYMKKQKEDSGSLGVKSELDRYLLEDQEPESKDFDILIWWKVNSPRFPILSQLARDVLAIPMSSVASECAFSTGGRILDPFRSSLTPKCVQCLICVQDWLRQETKPICVEESLEFLEKIELEMANSGRNSSIVDL